MKAPRLGILVAGLIGVLSVAAALAIGHLFAGFLGPASSPYLAVGNSAIDLTPGQLKEFAVAHFGSNDKPVLLSGMAVVLLVIAIVAGLLSRRKPWPGLTLAVVLGVLGVIAEQSRGGLSGVAVLSPIVSLLVGVAAFALLHHLALARASVRDRRSASGVPLGGGVKDTSDNVDTSGTAASTDTTDHQDTAVDADTDAVGRENGGITDSGDSSPRTTTVGRRDGTTRRRFITTSAGVAVGAGIAGVGGQLLADAHTASASRNAIGKLTPADPAPPIPKGASLSVPGSTPFYTSNQKFYRVDKDLAVPQLNAKDWNLRIHGMVNRERNYSFEDIRSRDLIERTLTLTCVSNEVGGIYVSTTNFLGIPLRDVLMEAGVHPGADQVLSFSPDGFSAGTPTSAMLDPERGAMLVIGMDRKPLPVEHGFPARLIVPGIYGYNSATKWVTEIELTTFAAKQAYWVPRGYSVKSPIKTMSRIDVPHALQQVPSGKTTVTGTAWAQPRGIKRVEVRMDNGPWQDAQLATNVNDDCWRMWRQEFDLKTGTHTVQARATDNTGHVQTEKEVSALPNGASGWPSIVFVTT